MDNELTINGRHVVLAVDPRTTLLDLLRERLALVGAKRGCNHGQCGACTVLVGGRRVLSCLVLAATVRESVTTIERITPEDGSQLRRTCAVDGLHLRQVWRQAAGAGGP